MREGRGREGQEGGGGKEEAGEGEGEGKEGRGGRSDLFPDFVILR